METEVTRGASAEAIETLNDRRATESQRILVVDDEKHIRKVLSLQLQTDGYRVDTASNGVEAIAMIENDPPDLVLLDVMMPQMDGYEVTRRLRENHRTSHIPIIMLTAKDQLQEKVKGLDGGANDYVTKPFAMSEILVRIRNVLHWSRLQREANPLTGLPGNLAIQQETERRIKESSPFAFVYIDIDNFKSINDAYGYSAGDHTIRFTAGILTDAVAKFGGPGDFIGHLGGDDFVLITLPERIDPICNEVHSRFDATVNEHYAPEDFEKGYVRVPNRQGKLEKFSLITLTQAVVTSQQCDMNHIARISDMAKELKNYGKRIDRSVVVKERRQ